MKEKGFTLIELLAVIAIILALAAIIFPALASVRRASYAAACSSNLKQIGAATRLYADDWDGFLPRALDMYNWSKVKSLTEAGVEEWERSVRTSCPLISRRLAPYGAGPSVWRCPADIGADFGFDIALGRLNNSPLWERFGESYLHISPCTAPAVWAPEALGDRDIPIAWDHVGFWHTRGYRGLRDYSQGFTDARLLWTHNVVFWDGSVRMLSYKKADHDIWVVIGLVHEFKYDE